MSELGRPLGLTFEEKEEPAPLPVAPIAPAAPDVGRPFDMNFGEGTQNSGPVDAASGVAPEPAQPAAPEPVAAADGVADQPAAPQAAPNAGEPGAMSAAEIERERRLAQSKAEYDSYLQKVMYAAGKMATDDGRTALIHDIIRHKGLNTVEGYDQVDRNFLADSTEYREWRISQLPPDLQELARNDLQAADEILRRGDRWRANGGNAASGQDKTTAADGTMPSFGEKVWGNISNFGAGGAKELAHLGADVLAAPAFIEKAGQIREVKAQQEIDAGRYNPNILDPQADIFYKNRLDLRLDLKDKAEAKAARPLSDSSLYEEAKGIKTWADEKWTATKGYEPAFKLGGAITRGVAEAGLIALSGPGGTTLVIAGNVGNAGFDALKDGATEEQAAENARRNVPIALFGALPAPNLLRSALDKQLSERFVTHYFRRGGIHVAKASGDAVESGMMAVATQVWQNQVAKEVYGKEGGLLDGADIKFLSAAVLSAGLSAGRAGYKSFRTHAVEANLLQQRGNNLYVEPQRLLQDHTLDTARIVEELAQAGPHIEQRSTQAGTLDRHINSVLGERGVGETGWMSVGDVHQLMRSGKLSQSSQTALKLQERIATAVESRGDVEISLPALIKSGLTPADMKEVVGNLKFHPKGDTVKDVGRVVAAQDGHLDQAAARLGKADRAATDGSYAFNKIRQELMDMGGGLTPAEVNRQAVRRIAHYEQRLRDNPDELPGESVNSLYLRDRFRASPKLRGDLSGSELRQKEEEYVSLFLNSLARQRSTTTGDARPPGAGAGAGASTPNQRRPASPRVWDYPNFRPQGPQAQTDEGQQP